MTFSRDSSLYNGGAAELEAIDSIADGLFQHLSSEAARVRVSFKGVQGNLTASLQVIDETGVTSLATTEELTALALRLRSISKAQKGYPWFAATLEISFYGDPNLYYDWGTHPGVSDEDLLSDLEVFPRCESTLPEWYPVAA